MSEELNAMFEALTLGKGDKKLTLKCLAYFDKFALESGAFGLPLNALFDCLNTSDEEQYELASTALSRILSVIPITNALNMYGTQIHIALGHPSLYVKKNLVTYLERNITTESLIVLCTTHTDILIKVLEYLACEDRSIAEGSVALFKRVGKEPRGREIIFSQDFIIALKRIMDVNDITRFRIYEIIVELSLLDSGTLDKANASGILKSLLDELKSPDTIVQLNGLELLTPLALNDYGRDYLEERGCIQYIVSRILTMSDDPLSVILLPGFIEFFGHLFAAKPEVFSKKYPEVLQLLFESFESVDPALQAVAIKTLGHISSSDEGKRVLLANEEKSKRLCVRLGKLLQCHNELGIQAMNALCLLLVTDNADLQLQCSKWFEYLGTGAMNALYTAARLPFSQPRLAALNVIKCLSNQPWGIQRICETPGFLEFLMDRSLKTDPQNTHLTYEILQSINCSPDLDKFTTRDLIASLNQYVKEGPFYVRTEPQVSLMESS